MKAKSVVLLAFAGICGLVAMLGVKKALNSGDSGGVETVSVLVAMNDLAPSTPLDESNTEFKAVPVTSVPQDVVTERSQYMDRVLKIRALPGDWITMSKLSEEGDYGLSSQIPNGMRVVTVSVNQTTSHSGMMLPGNRVDVMLTYNMRTNTGTLERTRTVLQYIEIFAVDKLVDGAKSNVNEANARNISVLVTPEQAHLLLLAKKKGDIHLALRSNQDTEQIADLAITAEELEGDGDIAGFGGRSKREGLKEQYADAVENGDPEDMDQFLEAAARGDLDDPSQAGPPVVVDADTPADVDVDVTDVDAEPEPDKWTVTIYSGGEATKHELIDEQAEEEEAATPATDTAAGQPSFWRGLLGAYFKGA